jgi:hypothetical protein
MVLPHDDVGEVDGPAGRAVVLEHEPEGDQLDRRLGLRLEPDVRGRAEEADVHLAPVNGSGWPRGGPEWRVSIWSSVGIPTRSPR